MKASDMRARTRELYALLPAILRARDEDQGGTLRELLDVVADEVLLLEDNLEQLYDDQFIETCAAWVVPYIGDLIGHRVVHGVSSATSSRRAEVANTIGYRRRKGTASVLEQLARDVTDWPAHVVEFFQLLATTQYMNHVRLQAPATADIRRATSERDDPFDTTAHRVDVRSLPNRGGRYNIPNIGIFLWRIGANPLRRSPATARDDRRFLFDALGIDTPLYTNPRDESEIASLAGPLHVPLPITCRRLHVAFSTARAGDYYGEGGSFVIYQDGAALPDSKLCVCNLEDAGGGAWAHVPNDGKVAVDPERGRIAFPTNEPAPAQVSVSYHYGFPAPVGGGEYARLDTFSVLGPGQILRRVPDDFASIQAAIDSLPAAGGIVEIRDSGRYVEALSIDVQDKATIELRAAQGTRAHVALTEDFTISGGENGTVTLNGLLISADVSAVASSPGRIVVPATAGNVLTKLTLQHCTLVPGLRLEPDGTPASVEPSLVIECDEPDVEMRRCLVGATRLTRTTELFCRDCAIDATAPERIAIAGNDADASGGRLRLEKTTVIGKVYAEAMPLVTDSIFASRLAVGDTWPSAVRCARKQEGCVRFSFVPPDSVTPRRFRCQPELEASAEIERQTRSGGAPLSAAARARIRAFVAGWLGPAFVSSRYGTPAYLQLQQSCAVQIRTGAEDESEMGVFSLLQQPQRETNLRVRLEEYLRFGLEAGIIYAS